MTQIQNLPHGSCCIDHFKRLQRWYDRFEKIYTGERYGEQFDYYFDEILVFFIFCHHLKDWIIKDTSIESREVEKLINDNECLQFCADIANGTKHLEIDRSRSRQNSSIKSYVILDESTILPDGTFPLVGLRFNLLLEDGRSIDAFEIASMSLKIWIDFLIKKGLIKDTNF